MGEGKVTVMAKEMVKIDHFVLFPPIVFLRKRKAKDVNANLSISQI